MPLSRAEIDKLPTLDPATIAQLRELVGDDGDASVVHEVLDLFLKTTPERMAVVKTALDAGQAVTVGDQAHCLKSASGSVGAARLSKLYAALEASAAGEPAEVREQVRAIDDEYRKVCEALAREFPRQS